LVCALVGRLSAQSLTGVEQARDVPEMGPAMPWIDNYIEESQLLAVNANVYDPNVGRLLDFGTATDREGHTERSFKVAGFACGLTGSDLGALNRAEIARRYITNWIDSAF